MNVLFLTMSSGLRNVSASGIYTDLMRRFRNEGHEVYIIYPNERRMGQPTSIEVSHGVHCLGVRTLNVTKTSIIEKGIGQLSLEGLFKRAMNKYFSDVRFDLILYSTPPITFNNVIKEAKRRNPKAMTYLLLKDIFPQNAVDIGMMTKTGVNGLLYKFFRNKEKKLYALSDYIGCMSPANVEYVLRHNPEIIADRVEVAPNSIELNVDEGEKTENYDEKGLLRSKSEEKSNRNLITLHSQSIRQRYGLPMDKPIFIYGGNLGKPQGIPFLIECLEANKNREDCFFLVVGTGTELPKLKAWYDNFNDNERRRTKGDNHATCIRVMDGLPKAEYDELVRTCDVGLIFLDHRFTIPNYPSRLLSYLENKMPVLCATDLNTDMGRIAEENGYGFWCESNSVEAFTAMVDRMIAADRKRMGELGYEFLKENYLIQNTYNAIVRHI